MVWEQETIHFWIDLWVGDISLAMQFPYLFRCAKDKEAYIQRSFEMLENEIIWCPIFRRNLMEHEEAQFLSLLNEILIQGGGGGCKIVDGFKGWLLLCLLLLLDIGGEQCLN